LFKWRSGANQAIFWYPEPTMTEQMAWFFPQNEPIRLPCL